MELAGLINVDECRAVVPLVARQIIRLKVAKATNRPTRPNLTEGVLGGPFV